MVAGSGAQAAHLTAYQLCFRDVTLEGLSSSTMSSERALCFRVWILRVYCWLRRLAQPSLQYHYSAVSEQSHEQETQGQVML